MTSGPLGRRQFMQGMGTLGMMATMGETVRAEVRTEARAEANAEAGADAGATSMRWPKLAGSPVLDSLHPVIEHSRDVQTNFGKLQEVAGWMAYEDLPMPDYALPLGVGEGNP